jgi:hypothetical protein
VRLPAVSFVQTKLDFAEPESESRTPCEHVCPDQARPIRLHPIRPVLGTTKIYKYKKKFNKKKKKKKKKNGRGVAARAPEAVCGAAVLGTCA